MSKASPSSAIVITSHVAGSTVGGVVTTAVLQARGVRCALVPTVLMGRHPGKGAPGGGPVDADHMRGVLTGLQDDGWNQRTDAIFLGYMATPDQVDVAAAFVRKAKSARPELKIVLDPIMGDGPGLPDDAQLYIRPAVAKAIRDKLVPLADVITPNLFELSWLSEQALQSETDCVTAVRGLGPEVIVTSSPAAVDQIGVLVVDDLTAMAISTPRKPGALNGAGDLFAAEVLAGVLRGESPLEAARVAAPRVGTVYAASDPNSSDLAIDLETLSLSVDRPLPRRVGATSPAWAMGVDGCPAGWCTVMVDMNGLEPPRSALYATFEDVLNSSAQIIAVDMPIGFQDAPGEFGMRACEREARQILGPRRSSIFPSPLRGALASADYVEASSLNRQVGGKGLSKQSFNLFPKLREIDELVNANNESFLFETHPETSFAVISGAPAGHSKKTLEGRDERLKLLKQYGLPSGLFEPHPYRRKDAAPDDLIDAGLCALTALRIAAGGAQSLPSNPPRDSRGLRMAIFA